MKPDGDEWPVFPPGGPVSVDRIQAAIRSRIARRRRGETAIDADDFARERAQRLAAFRPWNFPEATWRAMWPPHLTAWNLEQDFPIHSHRGFLAGLLVGVKRLQRAILRVALRPLLTQQVEINRGLALIARKLTDELTEERLIRRRLEAKVARLSSVAREHRRPQPRIRFVEDGECE